MIHISKFITELYNDQEEYAGHWQWFNNLITNVKLTKQQLEHMLGNLSNNEIDVWIKEVQDCYTGMDDESEVEAMKLKNYKDLAAFYANHPIEI